MASGFKPIKAKAKQFNYKPRYYDPLQEERELRREALTGRRLDLNERGGLGEKSYQPGDILRRQVSARRESRIERKGISSVFFLVLGLTVILVIAANIIPQLDRWFGDGSQQAAPTQKEIEIQEFNPYAPITIVPNDYKE